MSLTLTVDGPSWRAHLRSVEGRHAGLVPVAKGNGYGFTLARLARKAQWLGVDTLAVGTYDEVPEVAARFAGSILVLTPWRPFGAALALPAELAGRVIHTVSRPADLAELMERHPGARYVLEQLTTMLRHGMTARELRELVAPRGGRLAGVALHLPLNQTSHVDQVHRLLNDVVAAGLQTSTVWVSHLTSVELDGLRREYAEFTFRPRIGTDLWLGERSALRAHAAVLDVHPVERGEVFGYRGRAAPKSGHIVVVSGGTAHGIGLEAPTGDSSVRARAAALARGGRNAAGLVRSPYSIDGKLRLFAEPPHMQASMLFLPSGARVPAIGDELDVRVRFTTTTFDRIILTP
jgi:alanine racemase